MSLFRKNPRLTDRDIELLLSGSMTGSHDLADLERFVADLAAFKSRTPGDPGVMAAALAAEVRLSRRTTTASPRRAMRRLVAVAASTALLMAMSGIAMAADDAAPGDLLYGVDRAFELIGIGDGGVEERISEFDVLMSRGQREEAFQLLEDFIESAGEREAAEAQVHLETEAPATSNAGNDNVGDHLDFIEENKGKGVGADGRDFGQGVADIVTNREKDLPDQASENKPETPGNNANPDPGPPDHAGQATDPPSPPNSNANEDPGPPDQGNGGNSGNAADDQGEANNGNSGNAGSSNNPGNGNNANPNPEPPENAGKKDK